MMSTVLALVTLCGNAAAFVLPPSAASIQTAQANGLKRGSIARTVVCKQASFSNHDNNRNKITDLSFRVASRGGGLQVLRASSEELTGDDAPSSPRAPVDFGAMAKYVVGTGTEFGLIMGGLSLLQFGVLPRVGVKLAKPIVFLAFGFLAMKSRTFAVLNARRPKVAMEKDAINERRRPDWMPPPKVFPFIWITIGVLRAVSSTMVWEALGSKLLTAPIAAMVFHLSVGDTWNHINNVEKRLGVAVPVVFLVWLSVANTAFQYYKVLPKAGFVILPSVIWIAVANLLVQSIWRLNGKEPLYPAKKAN